MFKPIGLLNITIAQEYGVQPLPDLPHGQLCNEYAVREASVTRYMYRGTLYIRGLQTGDRITVSTRPRISYGSTTRRIKCFSEFG